MSRILTMICQCLTSHGIILDTWISSGCILAVCRKKPTVSRPGGFVLSQQDLHDVWSTSLPFSVHHHTPTALSSMTSLFLPKSPIVRPYRWIIKGPDLYIISKVIYAVTLPHCISKQYLNHSKLHSISWI